MCSWNYDVGVGIMVDEGWKVGFEVINNEMVDLVVFLIFV